jgi:hypothetical protein
MLLAKGTSIQDVKHYHDRDIGTTLREGPEQI